EQEIQEELSLHPISLEPWEIKPLAIPGAIVGIIVALFLSSSTAIPLMIALACVNCLLAAKYHPDFRPIVILTSLLVFFLFLICAFFIQVLFGSIAFLLNIIPFTIFGAICSMSILSISQGLTGEKLTEKRRLEIEKSYEIKSFKYKYFRKYWNQTLNKFVQAQSKDSLGRQSMLQIFERVQALEEIDERCRFLQKELNLNSSLIVTEGLPLSEKDISSTFDTGKISILRIELATKIEQILIDIESFSQES
ncbi:energy-coupling factor transporter transmembrane protein EcfT, partial [bacterium]|nr:energy-coupling factor transporter transmembrane protein EcfT [bacterium]